jgi:hypothetical protein
MPHHSPRPFRHASFHGRMGIARADITPPIGIFARNWGAAKHDVASSIHRPLPPAELYDEDIYTVWQTPFERGGYERLLETMIREIRNVLNN